MEESKRYIPKLDNVVAGFHLFNLITRKTESTSFGIEVSQELAKY